ncbi:hypothetical protein ACCO45_004619 [Purpureocillium lilacinum]|uniref:Uncharacterized protein n=1 Tax=Purpureocillium lilacinum TaxID=33203 RepID=A0ACC4DTT0_PURLI
MKSVTAIAAVCISAPSVALAAFLGDHTWGFANAPSDGLDSVRFPFRFFFAQDFHFTNVDKRGGFLGLQPGEDFDKKPFIRAIFSTFVEGAIPQSGNCREGAKVGPGVSCSIEWQHDYGDRIDGGPDYWSVGPYWAMEVAPGSGNIKNGGLGDIEYYLWPVHPQSCEALPRTEVTLFNPSSNTSDASGGYMSQPQEFGDCVSKVNFTAEQVDEGWKVTVGNA